MAEFRVELPDDLAEAVHFWAKAGGRPAKELARELLETGMHWNVRSRPKILRTLDAGLIDTDAVQHKVIEFLETEIAAFLDDHPAEVFCSLALDTNLDYGQVLISANTNELFDQRVAAYQQGPYAEQYRSEEAVRSLRTSVGDWGYTCIAELTLFTDTELDAIHNDLPGNFDRSWEIVVAELMELISTALIQFRATDVFKRVPTTRDFLSFCINHGEAYENAELRMIRASQQTRLRPRPGA